MNVTSNEVAGKHAKVIHVFGTRFSEKRIMIMILILRKSISIDVQSTFRKQIVNKIFFKNVIFIKF